MLVLDGNWRFLTVAFRSLSTHRRPRDLRRYGSLNGRPGYAFEAVVTDNRRLLERGGAPDTLRIVIRDPGGTAARVIEGEVTRGDIVVD